MHEQFSSHLLKLRTKARLTNEQLAALANVPESLISGLQNNNRRVGELPAIRIGKALNLTGEDLEHFIYLAINTSSRKVLNEAKGYPAQLLNLLAVQLRQAGILAESIRDYAVLGDEHQQDVTLTLNSGKKAILKTQLVCA